MRTPESKLVPPSALAALCHRLKNEGKTIVSTNGCFDLLHRGHVQYLFQAKALGDVLICGLNSDGSVRKIKGTVQEVARPVQDQTARALVLAALECVDYVCQFEEETPVSFLKIVRPNIHVKGGDYSLDLLPERQTVEDNGGKIILLPFLEGHSTSNLLRRIFSN